MKWSDVPESDETSSLVIQKLVERIDDIIDSINEELNLTESEIEWVKYDIKMWLNWKNMNKT
jgi:hypothetical protein